jgi:soluble lytic murein transglycosylase-like protein
MASENNLTIRDYFDRVMGGRLRTKKKLSATRTGSSAPGGFHQILSSRSARETGKPRAESGGLKASDYLARPVHAKSKLKPRPAFAAAKKTLSGPDIFAGPPALEASGASTPKTPASDRPLQHDAARLRAAGRRSLHSQAGVKEHQHIKTSIVKAAQKYDLPVNLITSVIRAESNFDARAVSRAGAQGLMQLMPETARALGVKNPFDVEENIDGGSRYLRKMLDSFGGDIKLALAAYNAGPEAVIKYGGTVPPYRETQQYVKRVLRFAGQTV